MTPSTVRAAAIVGVCSLLVIGTSPASAQSTPTFSKDVAPILYAQCTSCHRPGEIAPMSLLTYKEARPWARAIREAVVSGAMPPWHADPAHGTWMNERRLTDAQKDTIVRWVSAGAPEGNPRDLPPAPTYAEGWTIGTPDAVITMQEEYKLPATGEIEYQYFSMPTNFQEDKWIQALEVRPGNREVVHHVLVFAKAPEDGTQLRAFRSKNPPGPLSPAMMKRMEAMKKNPFAAMAARQQADRRGELIAQIAPGTNATIYTPGTALKLAAGTVLTFQVHYTTTGAPATDRSSIGFKFAPQPPVHEVHATAMMNQRFMIPAGAEDHPVESGFEALEDLTLYSMAPHTHLRGTSWHYTLTYPDGRTEVVLSVPTYDFNWQTDYVFATPLKMPKGAVLKGVARYDNSKNNPSNPDATQPVYWGDQTWEEMQYTGITFSIDKEARTTNSKR